MNEVMKIEKQGYHGEECRCMIERRKKKGRESLS